MPLRPQPERTGAWAGWIGRVSEATDVAAAGPAQRLAATLDRTWDGVTVPPLCHWLYHLPEAPQLSLGPDGHPRRGDFLPPVTQPRRMWAGGRLCFLAPIRLGAALVKRTTILDVFERNGTSGPMVFITLRHVIAADGIEAVIEEQDLVFVDVTAPVTPRAIACPSPEIERRACADAALLFRFSALTFNAHRIHYDADYARNTELYRGLVVHGPLQAMLLLGLAVEGGLEPRDFAFRGRAPLYADEPFTLARAGHELWLRDVRGDVTMTATVTA